MNTTRTLAALLLVISGSLAAGCGALSGKGDPGAARFFSLEQAPERPVAPGAERPWAEAPRAGAPGTQVPAEAPVPPSLRIGHVSSSPHLAERAVYRNSAYEIGYYREVRWTEPPEHFLQRRLERVLFEEHGLVQVVGGVGTTLEVRLTAFDEVRVPHLLARAQVIARLRDENRVLWEETVTEDRAVVTVKDGDRAAETVAALGEALQAVVDQVADRVVRELEKPR